MLGAAVTALTVAGHAAAAGQVPGLLGLVAVGVTATALCASAFAARRSLGATALLLLGLQLVGHVLLAIGDHGHGGTLVPSAAMLSFHAAAAIVSAVLIGHADELASRWARLLAPLVSPALVPAALTPARREQIRPAPARPVRRSACVGTDAGRAPPLTH